MSDPLAQVPRQVLTDEEADVAPYDEEAPTNPPVRLTIEPPPLDGHASPGEIAGPEIGAPEMAMPAVGTGEEATTVEPVPSHLREAQLSREEATAIAAATLQASVRTPSSGGIQRVGQAASCRLAGWALAGDRSLKVASRRLRKGAQSLFTGSLLLLLLSLGLLLGEVGDPLRQRVLVAVSATPGLKEGMVEPFDARQVCCPASRSWVAAGALSAQGRGTQGTSLRIASRPRATVYVDGKRLGPTPLTTSVAASTPLRVVLVAEGHVAHRRLLTPLAERALEVHAVLDRARYPRYGGRRRGILRVACDADDGEALRILIDGRETGYACPRATFLLRPGPYRIGLLDARSGHTRSAHVYVRSTQPTDLRAYRPI